MMKNFYLGYFFFDSIDMLRKSSGKQTYEVLLHHLIVKFFTFDKKRISLEVFRSSSVSEYRFIEVYISVIRCLVYFSK